MIEIVASEILSALFGKKKGGEGVPCRRAAVTTIYAGKNITTSLDDYQTAFSYTDKASGESDSIKLDIMDADGKWRSAWAPQRGDKIQSVIAVKDWQSENDDRVLNCGYFTLDAADYSGEPAMLSIGAVSAPLDTAFSSTEKTKTWEQVTLQKVATEIADAYGMKLAYDADDFTIKKKEQSKKSDADFLNELTENYGLCLKIYGDKLIIFDRAKYKQKTPVAALTAEDIAANWSYQSDLAGKYTGVRFEYSQTNTVSTATKSGKLSQRTKKQKVSYEYGYGPRWLKLNEKVDDEAEAERLAKGKLEAANHGRERLRISTLGNPSLVASQCIAVAGLGGVIDGKYYIDSITHDMGGDGYTCSLELSKV